MVLESRVAVGCLTLVLIHTLLTIEPFLQPSYIAYYTHLTALDLLVILLPSAEQPTFAFFKHSHKATSVGLL